MKIHELFFEIDYWFCNDNGTGVFKDKVSEILVSTKDNHVIMHLDRSTLRFASLNSEINAFNSMEEAKEYADSLMKNIEEFNTPKQGILF